MFSLLVFLLRVADAPFSLSPFFEVKKEDLRSSLFVFLSDAVFFSPPSK